MERSTSRTSDVDEHVVPPNASTAETTTTTKCISVVSSEYDSSDNESETDGVVPDFDALKLKPIVDCAAFKQLNRTEEFKNLLEFLDNIEIDGDGSSFSYVNASTNGLEELSQETTQSDTNSIFTRVRSYSKKYTPNDSHSSDLLDSCSTFESPNSTVSFISLEIKPLIKAIPPVDLEILKCIACDANKIITINDKQKEVRFYNQTAITFVNDNDPREINFEGASVNIIIDDVYFYKCFFNKPNIGFILDNQLHKMRLGTPTRELYIDDNYYSCSFNGPPIQCVLNNVKRSIKIVGDPPSIVIGNSTRQDLVAGISSVIVDSFHPVIIYLDAKPQCIDIGHYKLVLRFVDKLMSVLINNQYFKIDYGGEPLEISVQGHRHFLKFTKLPPCIHPGFTAVSEMLNIAPTEYTTNHSFVPSKSNRNEKTLKSQVDIQECLGVIKEDLSMDFLDSTDSLKILRSEIIEQLSQIENNQMSTNVSFTKHSVLPKNVSTVDKLSDKIQDDKYHIRNNLLYDLCDTELEITYPNNFKIEKRKMPTSERDLRKISRTQ